MRESPYPFHEEPKPETGKKAHPDAIDIEHLAGDSGEMQLESTLASSSQRGGWQQAEPEIEVVAEVEPDADDMRIAKEWVKHIADEQYAKMAGERRMKPAQIGAMQRLFQQSDMRAELERRAARRVMQLKTMSIDKHTKQNDLAETIYGEMEKIRDEFMDKQ